VPGVNRSDPMTHAQGANLRGLPPGLAGAAALLLAAAPALAEAGGEAKGKPYGDLGQAFIILIVFAGLLLILSRYAWKPIIAQIQRREKDIGEQIKDTERRNREAKELEAHYHARLDHAEAEAKQLLAKSLEEAAKAREDLLLMAREEGNRTIEAAKMEIEGYKQAAIEELRQATASMAVNIASEIIQEKLSPEKQEQLVAQSISRIRTRTEGGGS
jgi:F-type H+-transporting ATPase subunit b